MAFSGVFRSNLLCLIASPCSKQLSVKNALPVISTALGNYDSRKGLHYIQYRGRRKIHIPKDMKPIDFRSGDLEPYKPPSLQEILYKYKHITEINDYPKDLQKLFTVAYATETEKLEHQHMQVQEKVGQATGVGFDYEKLIAYLTVKIKYLMVECEKDRRNKRIKDYTFKRIDKRHKILNYMRHLDHARFKWLLNELKIDFKIISSEEKRKRSAREILVTEAQSELEAAKEKKREAMQKMFDEERVKLLETKKEVLEDITKDAEAHGISVQEILDTFREEQLQKQRALTAKPVKVGKMFAKFYEEEVKRKEKQLKIIPDPYVLGLKKR